MTPRWLGLYLVTIGALTLFPFSPPGFGCRDAEWTLALLADDFLMNTLLFVPLGFATYRGKLRRTAVIALGVSFAIEVSQHWLPRSPDVADLASNTLGAIIGYALARTLLTETGSTLVDRKTERALIRLGAVILLASTVGAALLRPASDFSNWRSVPLIIGNEPAGDRGWVGEVLELSIYDRALGPPELAGAAAPTTLRKAWKDGGPVLTLDLAGPRATVRLDGPDGPVRRGVEPMPETDSTATANAARFLPTGLVLDRAAGNHVFERLRDTGHLTIDARLHPHSVRWHGLRGSILSFGDAGGFNLRLSQYDGILRTRLRTPGTAAARSAPQLETKWNTLKGGEQHVRVTFDGYDAKMFVDGMCKAHSDISVNTAPRLLGAALAGTLVLCCALAALATGTFYRQTAVRVRRGLAAGAGTWLVLWLFGAWDHVPGFGPAAFLLGLLSLAATMPLLVTDRLLPRTPPASERDRNHSTLGGSGDTSTV